MLVINVYTVGVVIACNTLAGLCPALAHLSDGVPVTP